MQTGEKTIEARIYDTKRRELSVGDEIWYYLNEYDAPEVLKFTIKELIVKATFEELFSEREPREFGGESREELQQNIYTYYTKEEETENGVVGIVLEPLGAPTTK